jgi:hypothetical protein
VRSLRFFLAAVTFAGLTGHSAAQERIHVAVNLVNVGFTVRDAHGMLVDNLTSQEVEVFEDAVPQKVAFFARSRDVPADAGIDRGHERKPGPLFKTAPTRPGSLLEGGSGGQRTASS